eukprot:TRINITY_DN7808_c0_g1_i1.p1 TRINITY_DN7808_c0_g1~~TRINITY_DN7808_c0_g1_i1.p1  ORF type:complete len:142 (-),score=53.68 TRINITY_DN7808_c0_g1_i1:470-871(-)
MVSNAEYNVSSGINAEYMGGKDESVEEVTVVLDERQKEKIASTYKTPANPCIFVHPNTKAKSGKFDCRVESLSVLLDYRTEDNKEAHLRSAFLQNCSMKCSSEIQHLSYTKLFIMLLRNQKKEGREERRNRWG